MNLNEYQAKSAATAVYPEGDSAIPYCALGLCGESGEVAEKVKKVLRDGSGSFSDATTAKDAIRLELGDVLWYLAQLATELGLTLEEVAEANLQKLQSRQQRGKLGGSGDGR